MTDLNELKEQLYRKVKQAEQPEPAPNRMDLLKYSQVRANQSFEEWKQFPAQGVISPSFNNEVLANVSEYLQNALQSLNQAQSVMTTEQLDSRYSQLYTAICNAIHESNTALKHISDSPDE